MSLFDELVAFFEADGWPLRTLVAQQAITTTYSGQSGSYPAVARADEESHTLAFTTVLGLPVHPEARVAILETVARANFGLPLGCFLFDTDTGEIRFRTSLDVEGAVVTAAMIRNLVYTNCLAMDAYAPGFAAVLAGEATPERAIAQVEGG
jgi:hypothetical protein